MTHLASVVQRPRKQLSRLLGLFLVLLIISALLTLLRRHRQPLTAAPRRSPPPVAYPMPRTAHCLHQVLTRLRLPLSRTTYELRQLPRPLPLAALSASCRELLVPRPVSEKRRRQLACFLPAPWFRLVGADQRRRIRKAVHLLAEACEEAGVPLTLDAGTALGSWRMHGQIPYDPDVDFLIFRRHKATATAAMARLAKAWPQLFNYYQHGYDFWRMDVKRENGQRLFQIDIFFHRLAEKELAVYQVQAPAKIDASQLLPMVRRPFEGRLFNAYRGMPYFIAQIYGRGALKKCKPAPWIPAHFNIPCPTTLVRCNELDYFFNFARRWTHHDGKMVEVLFNRSHALSVFYGPES